MPTPQDPSDREIYLAQLSTSDESPEDLLSGGADIDDLIASGQLEIETEGWGWQTSAEVELSEEEMQPIVMSEDEMMAEFRAQQERYEANMRAYRESRAVNQNGQLSDRSN